MTKVKLCGLSHMEDIAFANAARPDYIGFVFAEKSRRYVSPETAKALKAALSPEISAVGVFVNAPVEMVAALLNDGTIDLAQLHGAEDARYLAALRHLTKKPLIQAFCMEAAADAGRAKASPADFILLDSGGGTGQTFDWSLLRVVGRPFFLAGGLDGENIQTALAAVHPYGVDVSSGVETNGAKDFEKMAAFVQAVRKFDVGGART